jgi:hypothetical protein
MPKKSRALVGGRPTVMTEEVMRKLEEAFSLDCTDEEACAYAGIGERTYDHKAAGKNKGVGVSAGIKPAWSSG